MKLALMAGGSLYDLEAYDWMFADWLATEAVLASGLLGFCTALPEPPG